MAITKYQKYDTITIHRSEIKNAPYNPRIMDEGAKKRLKNAIRKHGLVSAITWNKRTGNLVGGHQRLTQLDSLEKSGDYELTVCVIDVPEKEEAELNVQLNNPSMQGDWDLDKLAEMTNEFDLSFTDMGFSQVDVDFLFDGDDRFSSLFEEPEAKDMKEKLNEIKQERAKGEERLKEKNNISFYSVIVFESEKDRADFYKSISVPVYEEYLTVDQIKRLSRG